MPRGALFVSRRITDSKDPFVKWASGYLARRGEPVYALEPKANKHLFVEVSEDELEERCVALLLADEKAEAGGGEQEVRALRSAVAAMLKFVGGRGGRAAPKVHFSSEVSVAFVHGGHAFVPAQRLTRGLLLRVLGVIQVFAFPEPSLNLP